VNVGTRRWARKAAAGIACSGLVVGGLSSVSSAAPQAAAGSTAAPIACPAVMPTSQLQPGMTATGYTVSSGTTPQPFNVEILGVLPGGIHVGRDMIIVETSSPAIDKAGGIWSGMSGSPVYIGDKLVGAVAYGLSFGPSKIGGLTPASDMMDVLSYASGTTESQTLSVPEKVVLTQRQSARVAERAGVSAEKVSSFDRLKVPFGVSGVSGPRLKTFQETVEREGLPLIPFSGSSTPSGTAAPAGTTGAGDSFAAALSYGDITAAGIGTTTAVCNGQVLAFGHPFFFEGATKMGANQSSVIAVIDDPTFAPFKVGTVDGLIGVVDQDRLAAIRAMLGEIPELIDITSTVLAVDTGRTRDGLTQAVLSEWVPSLTFTHMFSNIDVVFDAIGEGSSSLSWTVSGTTESGQSWELNRSNAYVSEYDISFDSLWELERLMFTLERNKFEEIEFTGVDVSAEVDDDVRRYQIKGVRVARNNGKFRATKFLDVRRGDLVRLRVTLEPFDDSANKVVNLAVRVPRRARGSETLQVRGGQFGGGVFCLFGNKCTDEVGNEIESLDELIAALENAPRNDELRAMILGRRNTIKAQDSELLDQVVRGRKRIQLFVGGGGGGGKKGLPVAKG
jgi:SpoIVB peptidase S55